MSRLSYLASFLLITACSAPERAADTRNEVDPAIAAALAAPIMTDPELAGEASGDAAPVLQQAVPIGGSVEVPGDPPSTLGQLAGTASRTRAFGGCDPGIGYSAKWMTKLPADLALPNAARLSEAAGSDAPGCALRVVRYGIASTPAQVVDRYASIATRGGFTVERGAARLSAVRASDGAAFVATVAAIASGASVDLVSKR